MAGSGKRGPLHGVIAEFGLDVVGHDMHRHILPEIVSGDLHQTVVGTTPRPGCGSGAPGNDHAPGAGQKVLRAVSHRDILIDSRRSGDPDDLGTNLQSEPLNHFLRGASGRCM